MMPALSLRGRTILVVEDEFLLAELVGEALEEAGATVIGPVGWVDEALALVARHGATLDAAVLDINLHGALSYPIADALMAHGVPVVFTTGYDASAIEAAYQGCARCQKPLHAEALLSALVALGCTGPPPGTKGCGGRHDLASTRQRAQPVRSGGPGRSARIRLTCHASAFPRLTLSHTSPAGLADDASKDPPCPMPCPHLAPLTLSLRVNGRMTTCCRWTRAPPCWTRCASTWA